MLEQAIAKIKAEMEQNASNLYIQVVGGFLLNHLNAHPDDAEQILAEGKSIGKSLNEMERIARTKKVGNCAVLTDAEGFAVVLEYFGINHGQIGQLPSSAPVVTAPAPTLNPNPSVDFDVSLNDLLKG